MRKSTLGSLTGLLLPLAAYAAPTGYAYQRRQPLPRGMHQPLMPMKRIGLSRTGPEKVDENALTLTSGAPIRELVVVDAAVPDKHVFFRAARPGVEVVQLESGARGLAALAEVLKAHRDLAALHIVSHARDGELVLGDEYVTAENLKRDAEIFAALNGALVEDGDLLLYGCDLAAGPAGAELLEIIQSNAHVDVAASDDMTGSQALKGDWDLEIRTGDIEASLPFSRKALRDFSSVLAVADGTITFQSGWTDSGNTITHNDFVISAHDANTLDPVDVGIYGTSPFRAYLQSGFQSLNNYFYVAADQVDTGSFELTGLRAGEYSGYFTNMEIVGIKLDGSTVTSSTIMGTGAGYENFTFGADQLAAFAGTQLKGFKLYFETNSEQDTVPYFEFLDFTVANAQNPAASNATLTAGAGVTEPVGLSTTLDTAGEAANVLDFTIGDPGTSDSLPLTASQVILHKAGTATDADMNRITWRLNGPDASNITGTYDSSADTLTFSGLAISVASGGNETYTVNAYYNDNTGITDGRTVILSVDGDTDVTVGASSTTFDSTTAVNNGTGTTLDVVATALVFTTQPEGSVSGVALTTQPVVAAVDAFGNVDTDFTETLTLTDTGAGSLTAGTTGAATAGVATFSGLIYSATADQQSFALSVNDVDDTGSDLDPTESDPLTSDVVATKLLFTTQPAPLTGNTGVELDFSTDPVVKAVDANGLTDTGYSTSIVLAEANGAGAATLEGDGDTDGAGTTVTLTPASGVATFSNLKATYTNNLPLSNETWNLRATSGALTVADSSQVTSLGAPTISSATYNAGTGVLVVTGSNFQANGGGADVDVSDLTFTGEGSVTHQLTNSSDVDIDSTTQFTVTLSTADQAAVNQILNKEGAKSTGNITYNLAAADDFLTAVTGGNTADATNAITVSNVPAPTITSVAYDHDGNALILTGTGFLKASGANNDIDVSTLTITGEGGASYTLSTSSDVEIGSGTSATITLSGADIPNVEALLNKNGAVSATSGTSYNLAAAEDWNTGADASVNIADGTSSITVSNYIDPAISSATYDALTGTLVVTGTEFVVNSGATNDVDASLLTLRGGNNETYTLTDTADVEITSATEFTVTLSATDRRHVNGVLNKNGTASGSATTYNVEAADNWMSGAPAGHNIADTSGNGITVSNTVAPEITGATYDATTGIVVVTGTNLVHKPGADNDVDLSKLTFTGGVANESYTLVTATDVEITADTSFTFALSGADQANVNQLLDQLGKNSAGGSTYNIAGADDWLTGADASANIADSGPNEIDVTIPPSISSSTYDANTGVLIVNGANFQANGSGSDIDASAFTITGEGGATYTLTDTADVELDGVSAFTLTLSGADKAAINLVLNKAGTKSTGDTTYNLAAADDFATGVLDGDIADATNAITVSNVATPAITSATYDATAGTLAVTGTGLLKLAGATNDIVVAKLSITGEGGANYTLTSSSVEITSGTAFTVTLNATDRAGVNQLTNKAGTKATDGTTYNLAAAADWAAGANPAVSVADTTGNTITVSNVPAPGITSAAYDASTGVLVVTGSNMVGATGATNDVDATKLTFTGEGGATYTLTDTSDVELTSATEFTVTLSATDRAMVNLVINKNGSQSTGGTDYNLAAAEDWLTGADAAVTIADTANAVTASNVAPPAITSASYDYNANTLTLTGTGFLTAAGATNDIDVSTFTVTGEGAASYTLSTSSDVEITDGTTAVITLGGADIGNVEALLNGNGTVSATSATPFNLAAAEDWNIGADATVSIADSTVGITVSNYAGPAITSATYNATTGTLAVTGTDFVALTGADNDVDVSLLTLRGGNNETYTLTDSADVEITSPTAFTVTLSATDRLHVNGVLNRNGTSSDRATTYNLEAADNWMAGAPAGNDIGDTTGNGIAVSYTQIPELSGATYDAATGAVVVTGANFVHKPGADNDVDLSTLTFTGGVANATYTLTTGADVEITSSTSFTFTLSGADQLGVAALLDQLGTESSSGSTYNLASDHNWLTGADVASDITDPGPNPITVTVPPAITSSTYDASSGELVVTGTNFAANGSGTDIDVSKLTLSGEGGATYTLTDTADVERDSLTQFTVTLSAADKGAVNQMLNKDGTTSTTGATYNLAAEDDYVTASTTGDTADATNAVTVSNVVGPTLTNATYDTATGTLVVTAANLPKRDGDANDIDVSKLTFSGEGNESHTLTSTSVEITSGTEFTVTLNATDMAAVNLLVNKNGTQSTFGNGYNLAGAQGWAPGADLALNQVDNIGPVTASNVPVPAISGVTYNVNSGVLTVTGTGFTHFAGATNDIDTTAFTITGRGNVAHTLATTPDVEVTSGTSFTLTLSTADRNAVNDLLDENGTKASDNVAYNLGVAEDWARGPDAAVSIADAASVITVSGVVIPDPVIDTLTNNEGQTLSNVTVGANGTVEGGTLDGSILNDGLIRDVTLTPGTVITGDGTVTGTITGDPGDPALIQTHIDGDAVLSNVIIGADATIDPGAQLAGNVRFETLDNIPPGLDLSGALDAIPWKSRTAVLAVNLGGTLLANPGPGDLTVLEQIRQLDDYGDLDPRMEQDEETGELIVNGTNYRARAVPTSVTRVEPGTPPGTTINEDGDIEIVTESGLRVLAHPAAADPTALQMSFAGAGLDVDFDARGNLVVGRTDGAITYSGRPATVALPAYHGTTPGLHFHTAASPVNAQGVSMIYADADGVLWEQELVPVPQDWPALKRRLEAVPGAADAYITQDGIVSVSINGLAIRGRPGYMVSPGTVPSGFDSVQLIPAGDPNGDGIADYAMVFPNGDTQTLFILP